MLTALGVSLADGTLSVELDGTAPSLGYDRLSAVNPVFLGGALDVSVGFAPDPGDSFTILDHTAGGPISGTFAGIPEAATLIADGAEFQITYAGGSGNNDVVLTYLQAIPPTLAIDVSGPAQATISWDPATTGFLLQENLDMSSTNWMDASSGATNPITVPLTATSTFYRLQKP